jgi:hypothetical protein
LRRTHRHATGKGKPAVNESGCVWNEAETVRLASHFKLTIDNAAAKKSMN